MSDLVWRAVAVLAGAAVGAWWYAAREERVRGRGVAAVLRALAVALMLAGLRLPPLPARTGADTGPWVLLDVSRSMSLPAFPGGPTRIDSARAVVASLAPARVLTFGETPAALALDSALAAPPGASASRLAPALAAAGALGAGRVVVVGDGEWEDGGEALDEARRLGLGIEERRVAAPVARVGVRSVAAPPRAVAGDTLRLEAELVASGGDGPRPDSVDLVARDGGREVARTRVAAPSPGRRLTGTLRLVPAAPEGDSEWRAYEIALGEGADPYGAADRRRAWVEVSRGARGAVLVSLVPDWEVRFLLPVLEGAAAGGARAYVRVAGDRFLRAGRTPEEAGRGTVLRDARLADLLVVQADPARLPSWLRDLLRGRGRLLWLPRGMGGLAGTPLEVEGPLAGDWYPSPGLEASPISGYLAGVDVERVPPPGGLLELQGAAGWSPILLRRDRRGSALPLLRAGGEGERRWAAVAATGTWRWALREGASRRAYGALFAGLAGWLLEAPAGRPVELEGGSPAPDRPLVWRVAPGVRRLALAVYDSAGAPVWADTLEAPGDRITGPAPAPGPGRFVATGRGPGGDFRVEGPFDAGAEDAERLPRPPAPPLDRAPQDAADRGTPLPRRRPVWPFAAAALLLCAEWAWRRRIGLR